MNPPHPSTHAEHCPPVQCGPGPDLDEASAILARQGDPHPLLTLLRMAEADGAPLTVRDRAAAERCAAWALDELAKQGATAALGDVGLLHGLAYAARLRPSALFGVLRRFPVPQRRELRHAIDCHVLRQTAALRRKEEDEARTRMERDRRAGRPIPTEADELLKWYGPGALRVRDGAPHGG